MVDAESAPGAPGRVDRPTRPPDQTGQPDRPTQTAPPDRSTRPPDQNPGSSVALVKMDRWSSLQQGAVKESVKAQVSVS